MAAVEADREIIVDPSILVSSRILVLKTGFWLTILSLSWIAGGHSLEIPSVQIKKYI